MNYYYYINLCQKLILFILNLFPKNCFNYFDFQYIIQINFQINNNFIKYYQLNLEIIVYLIKVFQIFNYFKFGLTNYFLHLNFNIFIVNFKYFMENLFHFMINFHLIFMRYQKYHYFYVIMFNLF